MTSLGPLAPGTLAVIASPAGVDADAGLARTRSFELPVRTAERSTGSRGPVLPGARDLGDVPVPADQDGDGKGRPRPPGRPALIREGHR